MYKISFHNINLKHNNKHSIYNNQFVLTYSIKVFNQININLVLNDKSYRFPLKKYLIFYVRSNIRKLLVEKYLIITPSLKIPLLVLLIHLSKQLKH